MLDNNPRIEAILEQIESWEEPDAYGLPNTSALYGGVRHLMEWADEGSLPLIRRYLAERAGPYDGLRVAHACCGKFGFRFLQELVYYAILCWSECERFVSTAWNTACECAREDRDLVVENARLLLDQDQETDTVVAVWMLALLGSDREAYGIVSAQLRHHLPGVVQNAVLALLWFEFDEEICRDILGVLLPDENGEASPPNGQVFAAGVDGLRAIGTTEALAGLQKLQGVLTEPSPQLDEAIHFLRRIHARGLRKAVQGIRYFARYWRGYVSANSG